MRVGERRGRALPNGGELCLRLLHGGARREPSEDHDARALAALVAERIEVERSPVAVVHREAEPLGHDADDRVDRRAKPDGAAEDVRVAAEARLPDIVSDDQHRRCAGLLVLVEERPA